MHFTSLFFWLMMVSTPMAVFPVCRSPMTNSRWPRPMGTVESITFKPVIRASVTGCRSMTPGALRSIGSVASASMGPLPSMGTPRGLTTRPKRASPTGTSAMRPVRLASSPSRIRVSSPNNTHPTLSASRLRAIPIMPLGNATSSLVCTLPNPCTRATPSPTCCTRPLSYTSISIWESRICCLSRAEISSGRICKFVAMFCLPSLIQTPDAVATG